MTGVQLALPIPVSACVPARRGPWRPRCLNPRLWTRDGRRRPMETVPTKGLL